MDNTPVANPILCTQCGGELHPDEGQMFLTCPYCSSTVYVDKSKVVFHFYLAPTLDQEKAQAFLARWMAGNQTVKDLDKKARITGVTFEYFPVWYFKRKMPSGADEILLELAAASSVSELKNLKVPAGDLRKYDPNLDSQAHQPTVPLEAALQWLEQRGIQKTEIVEMTMVHIPLYTFKYEFKGKLFTAIIEAGTSGVFANIFPAKAEAPYLAAGGAAAAVFLCLATFPVIGALVSGANGAMLGLAICAGVGVVVAPVLFVFAAWVAAKV